MIPYGKHYIDEDDIQAVTDVLRHGWLTQGPKIAEFESNLAKAVGAKYAVAVSSATAALHLCCVALDVVERKGKVFTSANTFVASANCAKYVGATPDFCDIDEATLNMCPKEFSTKAELHGCAAVIPVHFGGVPCDMEQISEVARKHSAAIIEDASHALGGTYTSGEPIGSCVFSDVTVFSLHPVKGVTAGEGGVITTNNDVTYKKLLAVRSHGIQKGNFDLPGVSHADDSLVNREEAFQDNELNPWYYEMQELGFNYRITDIQCALANSQLNKLGKFISRRRELAKHYDEAFSEFQLVTPVQKQFRDHSAHHLYVVRIDFESAGIHRKALMEKMAASGLGSQVHYIPVPMQPYYQDLGHKMSDYPKAYKYYKEALSIPLYFGLADEDAELVVAKLKESIEAGLEG